LLSIGSNDRRMEAAGRGKEEIGKTIGVNTAKEHEPDTRQVVRHCLTADDVGIVLLP